MSSAELRAIGSTVISEGRGAQVLAGVPPLYREAIQQYPNGPLRVGAAEWARLLQPDAWIGTLLRNRLGAVVRGTGACATLFVHAGLLPDTLAAVDWHIADKGLQVGIRVFLI